MSDPQGSSQPDRPVQGSPPPDGDAQRDEESLQRIPLDSLTPGRFQPRRDVSRSALTELANSIRAQGVIQPLIVRPAKGGSDGEYEIIAGERRWQAARLAGLTTVPVIVRESSDRDALALALIENLQREDLNAVDQAVALKRLTEEFSLTHKAVAEAVGRSRSAVSNLLRLLELHPDVQAMLTRGQLEMGHARALLSLDDKWQLRVARRAAARHLSVREVERIVQQLAARDGASPGTKRRTVDMDTRWFQELLTRDLGQQVAIRMQKDGRRRLGIDFESLDQLKDALEHIRDIVARLQNTAGPRARAKREPVKLDQ